MASSGSPHGQNVVVGISSVRHSLRTFRLWLYEDSALDALCR
jgi:hypothetical protein